jgi:CubicO group peptidase (beta-lactamase class C family)
LFVSLSYSIGFIVFNDKYENVKLSWGLGLGLFQASHGKSFFHSGHSDGWQNYFVAYPEKKIAVILMSNSDNFERAGDRILDATIRGDKAPLEWLGYFDRRE